MLKEGLRLATSYPVFSRFLAAVFLVAGVLKGHDYWAQAGEEPSGWLDSGALGLGATLEVLLAGWLAMGFLPRVTRCVLIGVFIAFMNLNLSSLLAGSRSCGCLGQVELSPHYAILFSVGTLSVLLFGKGIDECEKMVAGSRLRRVVFTSFAVVVLVSAGVTAYGRRQMTRGGLTASRSHEEAQQLLTIRQANEANDARFPTSVHFNMQVTDRNLGVEKETTTTHRLASGGVVTSTMAPSFRSVYQYALRGEDARRDTVEGAAAGRLEVVHRGRYLLLSPPSEKRAWYMNRRDTPEASIDPRVLGLRAPVIRMSEWLDKVAVKGVTRKLEGEVELIEVQVEDHQGGTASVSFSSSYDWLPVRIARRYKDGSCASEAVIAYARIPESSAWLMRSRFERRWPYGMKREFDGDHVATTEHLVLGPVLVNQELPASFFDPKLPAGCIVSNQAGRSSTLRMINDQTTPLTLPVYLPPSPLRQPRWMYLAGLNGLMLALCLVFRKQLWL